MLTANQIEDALNQVEILSGNTATLKAAIKILLTTIVATNPNRDAILDVIEEEFRKLAHGKIVPINEGVAISELSDTIQHGADSFARDLADIVASVKREFAAIPKVAV